MRFPRFRRSSRSMERLYNWFHNYYGSIERSLGPTLDAILEAIRADFPGRERASVLEYACGSGLLSLKLAPLFKSVDGRDLSAGMIGRAKARADAAGAGNVSFRTGNMMEPDEGPGSYDYVFVSFAMHLFPPDAELRILQQLFRIARKAVVVIDHGRRWDVLTAVIEWLEGGYYDVFIRQDFNEFADRIGAGSLIEKQIKNCTILLFRK